MVGAVAVAADDDHSWAIQVKRALHCRTHNPASMHPLRLTACNAGDASTEAGMCRLTHIHQRVDLGAQKNECLLWHLPHACPNTPALPHPLDCPFISVA